jgi:hypothetical protein
MINPADITKLTCATILFHMKNNYNWSQTDTHLSQFFVTVITALPNGP